MYTAEPALAFIKKNEIAVFIIIAYIFSWAFWIPLEFADITSNTLQQCLYYVGALGPLLAAIVLLLATPGGMKGLAAGSMKWRTGIEWYMAALFLPLAIEAAVLLAMAASGTDLTIKGPMVADGYVFLGQVFFSVVTAIPLFAFLLPRLLKSFNPLVSSLFAASIFLLWHAPFVMASINNGRAAYELWWAIGNLGIFFAFTWIYRNVKGGLLPLIFLNLGLNYFRWLAKGVMQASPSGDAYVLDFALHLAAGLIILLANVKYFMGRVHEPEGSPAPLTSARL